MHAIGERFSRWQKPTKVFTNVLAVPTIFPAIDVVVGVGGIPLERYLLVHGPSSGGKTQFVIGVGLSFLNAGHFFGFLEPEMTATEEWLRSLMGDQLDSDRFVGHRPESYEDAVDSTRQFCRTVAASAKGKPIGGLVGLDSLTKLAPKGLVDQMMKDGAAEKDGVDGMSGAAGRAIAALNSQWCRELTGLLYHTKCSMLAIVREREAMMKPGMRGPAYKISGGTDVVFEASLRFRIRRAYPFEYKEAGKVAGSRYDVTILKTKLADSTIEKLGEAFFHVANGEVAGVPAGFDRARDVWALALEMNVVKPFRRKGGTGFETWDGEQLPSDESAAVMLLRTDEKTRQAIENECRKRGLRREDEV